MRAAKLSELSAEEMQSLTLNELAGAIVRDAEERDDAKPEAPRERKRPQTLPGHASRRSLAVIKAETAAALSDYPGCEAPSMPRNLGECIERFGFFDPCPFVRCRHHLAADVVPARPPSPGRPARDPAVKVNFPHAPTAIDIPYTCSLREALTHPEGLTLEEVAARMNVTRERCRQIEESALLKLRPLMALHHPSDDYDDHFDDDELLPAEEAARATLD